MAGKEKQLEKPTLIGLTPTREMEPLRAAKLGHGIRKPLYDMKPKERELVLSPIELLGRKGMIVPQFGKDSIFVTTGPNNGELINKKGEKVSYVFSGNDILYSINGSPRESIKKLMP